MSCKAWNDHTVQEEKGKFEQLLVNEQNVFTLIGKIIVIV